MSGLGTPRIVHASGLTHGLHPQIIYQPYVAGARGSLKAGVAIAGLEAGGAAVRAALTQPWGSGQAEGQINHIKLLKRQSYGRASFDLLRRRVLRAA